MVEEKFSCINSFANNLAKCVIYEVISSTIKGRMKQDQCYPSSAACWNAGGTLSSFGDTTTTTTRGEERNPQYFSWKLCRKFRNSKCQSENCQSRARIKSVKKTLTHWFTISSASKSPSPSSPASAFSDSTAVVPPPPQSCLIERTAQRELPPIPVNSNDSVVPGTAFFPDEDDDDTIHHSLPTGTVDFATTIEKVKEYGWYWGPISGEVAERLLEKEPDGSFVVRDSSDDHYIFSLTVKLNSVVRHVRIEHGQGNFSFGSSTRFRSNTIGEFIENAVEHSQSGRYLFFLHRRPELGPMRVQLLYPVSRFKQIQSLQHLSRFVILKHVSRDILHQLPVPKRICDYLNTPFYYSEVVAQQEH